MNFLMKPLYLCLININTALPPILENMITFSFHILAALALLRAGDPPYAALHHFLPFLRSYRVKQPMCPNTAETGLHDPARLLMPNLNLDVPAAHKQSNVGGSSLFVQLNIPPSSIPTCGRSSHLLVVGAICGRSLARHRHLGRCRWPGDHQRQGDRLSCPKLYKLYISCYGLFEYASLNSLYAKPRFHLGP